MCHDEFPPRKIGDALLTEATLICSRRSNHSPHTRASPERERLRHALTLVHFAASDVSKKGRSASTSGNDLFYSHACKALVR